MAGVERGLRYESNLPDSGRHTNAVGSFNSKNRPRPASGSDSLLAHAYNSALSVLCTASYSEEHGYTHVHLCRVVGLSNANNFLSS